MVSCLPLRKAVVARFPYHIKTLEDDMKKLILILSIIFHSSLANADSQLTKREALYYAVPSAFEVIQEMERNRGIKFKDSELESAMESEEFLRRIKLKRGTDIRYSPCRIEGCRPA